MSNMNLPELTKLDVRWYNDYTNEAQLELHINKKYVYYGNNSRYEKKGSYYYMVNEDGLVICHYYTKPGQGYAGRHFPITLTDGTEMVLIGPWDNGSKAMNEAGLPKTTEVTVYYLDSNRTPFGSYMLVEYMELLIKEYLPELQYNILEDGRLFLPKNQPLNENYPGSYACKRDERLKENQNA